MNVDPRLIAFYLPQFHPIPENDTWWGAGFTEWNNVVKALPLFKEHYQPHLPADLGFYDLRLPEARQAQATLARDYGLHGFCYYHYWFNGRRLLERPFSEVLASSQPDFPFCLCWANENWTRAWDGLDKEVLLEQYYSPDDDRRHLRWLADAFRDHRYIRVNGKPLFIVYRVSKLQNPRQTADIWREEANRLGIGDLYLCVIESFDNNRVDPDTIGFDAAIEFQPDWLQLGAPTKVLKGNNRVFNYAELVERMLAKPPVSYKRFPSVVTAWDNTPRRSQNAFVFQGSTPQLYQQWLQEALTRSTATAAASDENIVFINAWNEWAEGAHLEPDQKWGRAYLEATLKAVQSVSIPVALPKPPIPESLDQPSPVQLSVCIPAYNGADYVGLAIESILKQTGIDFELLVVDDQSSDGTEAVVRSFADPRIRFIRNPTRLGLVGNWNRCLELARGDYICIFHQDDVMEPGNLAAKVSILDQHPRVGIVYSSVSQIGPAGELISEFWYVKPVPSDAGVKPGKTFFRRLLLGANEVCCPSVVIRRDCYEKLGGFDSRLPFTADWEMWLRIALFYDVAYLIEPLIKYRRHTANESLNFYGPKELDHYYQAKMLALEKFPDQVPDLDKLRMEVNKASLEYALEQTHLHAARGEYSEARQYVLRAANYYGQASPNATKAAYTAWLLNVIDEVWQKLDAKSVDAGYAPPVTTLSQQPLRYQPIFRQVMDSLSGRDIADNIPLRKILQAIAFRIAARPGFRWLNSLKGVGKKLLE